MARPNKDKMPRPTDVVRLPATRREAAERVAARRAMKANQPASMETKAKPTLSNPNMEARNPLIEKGINAINDIKTSEQTNNKNNNNSGSSLFDGLLYSLLYLAH